MILVLLGPPGAGKGTQANRITADYGTPHISTGDLFRDALKENSELGQSVKGYLESGQLVPDEVTTAVLAKRMAHPDCAKGATLDGFPRTLGQAHALDRLLAEQDRNLDAVLYFDVTDETAVERLGGRRMCRQCGANYHLKFMPPRDPETCDQCGGELYQRADDCRETIRRRLKVYAEQTEALVGEYQRRGLLKRIDANGAPNDVAAAVAETLRSIAAGD